MYLLMSMFRACMHTAKPSQPTGTSGTIEKVLDQSVSSEIGTRIGAIASLNWNPPENHDETAIDSYELTLIGTPTNSTYVYSTTKQPMFSYVYVLSDSEGNYTDVSITAVDLCEQRSKPSKVELRNINSDNPLIRSTQLGPTMSMTCHPPSNDDKCTIILATVIALLVITIIVIFIVISIICYMCNRRNNNMEVAVPEDQNNIELVQRN